MKCLFCLVIFIYACFRVAASQSFQGNPYWHRVYLDGTRQRYLLTWRVDWTQSRVNFSATVQTQGYVAFGLARQDKMDGADIVIGGVIAETGTTYFRDYHAIGNQQPVPDRNQDWTLHFAEQNGTHTTLEFSRSLDTCDNQDIPISDDALFLIWAYGETDNVSEFHYQNRGAMIEYLLDPDITPRIIHESNQLWEINNSTPAANVENIGDAQRWRVRQEFQIPPKRTTYWCNIKKFSPTARGRHHVIGFNTRINAEARQNMHHMLLFRCKLPLSANPALVFEPLVDKEGQECYDFLQPQGPIPTMLCADLIGGHAIGGKPLFFPEHIGLSIGESNADEYFLLQIHYDNPTSRPNIRSDIQMDIYYTATIREFEAGKLSLGQHIPGSPSMLIPPGEQNHRIYGHCSRSCTEQMLPQEGIRVVAVLLHTHVSGRRIRLKHFRNDRELPWPMKDDNYKFQFQTYRMLREERMVLPGDQLSVECYYDTTLANKTVVGGYGTDQEMCKVFLIYYNKLEEYPLCRSEIQSREYMSKYLAGTQNVTWNVDELEYVATWPLHVTGRTISNISDSQLVNWDINLRNDLRQDHIIHSQRAICPSVTFESIRGILESVQGVFEPPEYVSHPVHINEYRQKDRCTLINES